MDPVNIFWFRRDLRLEDNAGLYHALRASLPVLPVFIFDKNILGSLGETIDKRVIFIRGALEDLNDDLSKHGCGLSVVHDKPLAAFRSLLEKYNVASVYTNHDYEPYATARDKEVAAFLKVKGIAFHTFKDQVIFEKEEIVKDNGDAYTIFTPYSKKWLEKLDSFFLKPYPAKKYFHNFYKKNKSAIPSLKAIGFEEEAVKFPSKSPAKSLIAHYDETRDFPGRHGTTHLGIHLRFGTISIRKLAAEAQELNPVFLKELVWREFFQMILWHHPSVVSHSFRPEYDKIKWRNNDVDFQKWCEGKTGFPIVDAGMRELNETGFMHNRVRMITANFLTKLLLIDWRWGEAYFAAKLLDYELASNNGNWQWAAGSGCDASPYFRIFNPMTQHKKFDPQGTYIKRWITEPADEYPKPIVDYREARQRALKIYGEAVKEK